MSRKIGGYPRNSLKLLRRGVLGGMRGVWSQPIVIIGVSIRRGVSPLLRRGGQARKACPLHVGGRSKAARFRVPAAPAAGLRRREEDFGDHLPPSVAPSRPRGRPLATALAGSARASAPAPSRTSPTLRGGRRCAPPCPHRTKSVGCGGCGSAGAPATGGRRPWGVAPLGPPRAPGANGPSAASGLGSRSAYKRYTERTMARVNACGRPLA